MSFSVVYAQEGCPEECDNQWSNPIQLTITAPGFPGCNLVVVFRQRKCDQTTNGFLREILYWGPSGGNCDAFLSTFIPSWPNTTPPVNVNQNALATISQNVMTAAAEQIFLNFYNSLPQVTEIQDDYWCPNYNDVGTTEFHFKNCQSTCVSQNRNDLSKVRVAHIPCSTDECCAITRQHCFNPTTSQVETQETTTTTGTPSCQGPLPDCGLTPNFDLLFQSACGIVCQ